MRMRMRMCQTKVWIMAVMWVCYWLCCNSCCIEAFSFEEEERYLKKRDPTLSPTLSPTTGMPSKGPSVMPSITPSMRATISPTAMPSKMPSIHDTVQPSVGPSSNIVQSSSTQPSLSPSFVISMELQPFSLVLVTSEELETSLIVSETQTYLQQSLQSSTVHLVVSPTGRKLEDTDVTLSLQGSVNYSSATDNIPTTTDDLHSLQASALTSDQYLQSLQTNVNPNIVQTSVLMDSTNTNNPPPNSSPSLSPVNNNNNNNPIVTDNGGSSSNMTPIVGALVAVAVVCIALGGFLYWRKQQHQHQPKQHASSSYKEKKKQSKMNKKRLPQYMIRDHDDDDEEHMFNNEDVISIKSKSTNHSLDDNYSQNIEVRTVFTEGGKSGDTRGSDAFSLEGGIDMDAPNSGQIMLNQVMAMSAYSAENGAQFVFDQQGYVSARRPSTDTHTEDEDEMTEFSYSNDNHIATANSPAFSRKMEPESPNHHHHDNGIEVTLESPSHNTNLHNNALYYNPNHKSPPSTPLAAAAATNTTASRNSSPDPSSILEDSILDSSDSEVEDIQVLPKNRTNPNQLVDDSLFLYNKDEEEEEEESTNEGFSILDLEQAVQVKTRISVVSNDSIPHPHLEPPKLSRSDSYSDDDDDEDEDIPPVPIYAPKKATIPRSMAALSQSKTTHLTPIQTRSITPQRPIMAPPDGNDETIIPRTTSNNSRRSSWRNRVPLKTSSSTTYQKERLGGSRTTSSSRLPTTTANNTTPTRSRTMDPALEPLSPGRTASNLRRNRLARDSSVSSNKRSDPAPQPKPTSQPSRTRGTSVSAAELRKARLAKQAATSSQTYRNSSHGY